MRYVSEQNIGFTLIEMLAILTIMSVLLGLVMADFQRDERQLLQTESHRLALLLNYAMNTSRTTGQKVAWQSIKKHYLFMQYNLKERKWKAIENDGNLKERTLPDNINFGKITISGMQANQNEMIVFSPAGINAEFKITMLSEHTQVIITGDMLGNVVDASAQELQ